MKPIQLTVFTEPIYAEGFLPRVRSVARPLKSLLKRKKVLSDKKYGGHYAVTRSLVERLQKIGADFNYNPINKRNIRENVIVLAGVERLRDAIALKKKGTIRFLMAGPNIVDDVRSENELVADPAIDYYIVPSAWVKELVIKDCSKLKDRVLCWSAGIDSQYWKPAKDKGERDEVLVYWKTEPEEFYQQ